ncbi:hypothetical protein PBOR_04390 [Paenibacillus borealis]|uniref:Uncharacterized protein n=1 Tax=Paenibacillus borealis TaxID=160799 RepID=A0A089MI85_PAEBO|nr:hypothetical protein PBOR_04390 [Paenibacillus borealis]
MYFVQDFKNLPDFYRIQRMNQEIHPATAAGNRNSNTTAGSARLGGQLARTACTHSLDGKLGLTAWTDCLDSRQYRGGAN